jgi:hypothetical protein
MPYKMRPATITRATIAITLLSLLVLVLAASGCGKSQAAAEPQTTAEPSASAKLTPSSTSTSTRVASTGSSAAATKPTSTVKASTTPSPTALPKLTDVSFTLTLDAQQEYIEYTNPIYLKASQILHLTWVVIKGSDHFYMTFTLPNGKLIGVRSNGSLASLPPGGTPGEKLTKSGDVVFRPDDNDWQDGYYIFHPQIYRGDPAVTVKLLYWIES